jgi:hypothetical protein
MTLQGDEFVDIFYIALTLGFFLASGWLVRACTSLAMTEEEKK